MLNRIDYEVTFPTERTFSASTSFSTGLTAVMGRNESGKSLLLEMIRYGLFGAKALRGKSADYKKLKLSLEFSLGDEDYRVERTGSNAKLYRGDDQVAVGAKPVNERIAALFGYSLEVFDVANACLQGEIERLGNMRPTERKALVDRTIGLDAVDKASDVAQTDLIAARAQLEVLDQDIVVPPEPQKPEGYRPSSELRDSLTEMRSARDELVSLRAWLEANPPLPEPTPPQPIANAKSVEELQALAKDFDRKVDRLGVIEHRIRTTSEPELSLDEIEDQQRKIEAYARFQSDQAKRSAAPASEYDVDVLDHVGKAQEAARIQSRIDRLSSEDQHECPSCEHVWSDNDDTVAQLQQTLPIYDAEKLPEGWASIDVALETDRNERHSAMLTSLTGEKNPGEPEWTAAQLSRLQDQWQSYNSLGELRAERRKLESETAENPHEQLQEARTYEAALEAFNSDHETWQNRAHDVWVKTSRVSDLEKAYPGDVVYDQTLPKLELAVAYESQLRVYEQEKARFAEQELRVKEKRAEVVDLEAVRASLRQLKAKIKNHLLPSLNTVASVLLTRMTGGERNEIRVNEDFEILVDGQPLATLSGSGKAVANLAIRLGLGQVLTNKTFSVFLADEIDAAMDIDRAGYTSECLANLTGSIAQVVIVSHKTISAPHHIEMGTNTHANDPGDPGDGDRRAA